MDTFLFVLQVFIFSWVNYALVCCFFFIFTSELRQLKNIKAIWKMGLYDHFKTLSPQWSDGSLLSYRNFFANVPSDPNFQCMTIDEGTWLWINRYCDVLTNFICESSKSELLRSSASCL